MKILVVAEMGNSGQGSLKFKIDFDSGASSSMVTVGVAVQILNALALVYELGLIYQNIKYETDLYVWNLVFVEYLTDHHAIVILHRASIFHKQSIQYTFTSCSNGTSGCRVVKMYIK